MRATPILFSAGAIAGMGAVLAYGRRTTRARGAMHVRADRASYVEAIPGVGRAVLEGNPDRGAYKAFTRFAPGILHSVHTHSHDIWIVVLHGAYLYEPVGEPQQRVEAGSCLFIPGGTPHVSGGDAREGALFFEQSSGAFDMPRWRGAHAGLH